jgi:hypothetical protein
MVALRQICADYHVFGCTYAHTEMTMLDLERAATSHHRFASRLQHEFGEEPLIPMVLRVIPGRSNTYSMQLVPGGRFMLTYASAGGYDVVIQLWDLDFALNYLPNPHPLAITKIPGLWLGSLGIPIQRTSDGLGIRVLVPSSPTHKYVPI